MREFKNFKAYVYLRIITSKNSGVIFKKQTQTTHFREVLSMKKQPRSKERVHFFFKEMCFSHTHTVLLKLFPFYWRKVDFLEAGSL